jgi:hypothetical protein
LNGRWADALADLGFAPVSSDAVPNEVRSTRSYPKQAGEAAQLLRLELETRF